MTTKPRRIGWNLRTAPKRIFGFLVGGPSRRPSFRPGHDALAEVVERARTRTDISDHLVTIFCEAMAARPRLIVELGVRGGESTFVMQRVAAFHGARLVSVDIVDCSRVAEHENAVFVQADDVAFAERFAPWCRQAGIEPRVDVLFIDTSHEYEHTVREIEGWFPHLSADATVLFHDTHLVEDVPRRDGSRWRGGDNERGVIRAIEERFRTTYDETVPFDDFRDGWLIRHDPVCGGLTVLRRVTPRSCVEEVGQVRVKRNGPLPSAVG